MSKPKYSVVVPVFNSEESLAILFEKTKTFFNNNQLDFEMIFVHDGGDDNSWDIISTIKKDNPGIVTGIDLVRNFGQHKATFCGFHYAKGDFIITIDDDLQVDPAEIGKLIASQQQHSADLVYGIYPHKKHSALRNAGSATIKKTSKKLLKAPGKGSSFRLIKKEIVNKMLTYNHRTIFIDELVLWYTGNIAFVEVEHNPRPYKQSGYNIFKLTALSLKILFYSTVIPLKAMIYGGFVASLVSMGFGIYHIYRKVFFKVPLGYTSVIVTVFFSTSILLFSLGIIGEYMRRVYEGQNRKEPFLIRKII